MKGGGFEVGALRGQGCTKRARSESDVLGKRFYDIVRTYDVLGRRLHGLFKDCTHMSGGKQLGLLQLFKCRKR